MTQTTEITKGLLSSYYTSCGHFGLNSQVSLIISSLLKCGSLFLAIYAFIYLTFKFIMVIDRLCR